MRRRPVALPLAIVVLLLGAGGAAAQEPAAPLAEPAVTPAPAPPTAPVTEPAPPAPAAAATPEPAAAPVASAAPPAPAASPAPPPAPVAAAARPAVVRKAAARPHVRVRRTPARAPNQEQADGRIELLDGHVRIGSVPPAPCAPDTGCAIADYEVGALEVRADPDGPALIDVRRARAHGPSSDRRIEVDITLRPPGGEEQAGTLELLPQQDLLDPATYRGTPLEAAFDEVLEALRPLIGEGGSLEGLEIAFGAGFVKEDGAAAVAVSTTRDGFVIYAPVERGPSTAPVPGGARPVSRPVPDSGDTGDDPQREAEQELVVEYGEVMENVQSEEDSGGGGPATAVAGFAGSVVGALVTGACQAVGDRDDCDEDEQLPPFVIDVLTVTLFVSDDGRGVVEVRCPDGYEGVTGTLGVYTEIRLGQEVRRLADDVRFTCDERVEEVRVQLRPDALGLLEDQETVAARLTVVAGSRGGQRDTDANEHVSIRLRSRSRDSG